MNECHFDVLYFCNISGLIINYRFLQRPQKSRRNQLIHRRLSKTKSIGMDSGV